MKISIYNPPPKSEVVGDASYMMVHLTPSEAGALIASLGRQLETGNPNTGRLEAFADEDGDFRGYFSITVAEPMLCVHCGKKIEPYSGKMEKGGLLCKDHLTHKEQNEKETTTKLNKAWKKMTKKNKDK